MPIISTMREWCANFQRGDATRFGRPSAVSNQEIVDHLHDFILADGCLDTRDIQGTRWDYNS